MNTEKLLTRSQNELATARVVVDVLPLDPTATMHVNPVGRAKNIALRRDDGTELLLGSDHDAFGFQMPGVGASGKPSPDTSRIISALFHSPINQN